MPSMANHAAHGSPLNHYLLSTFQRLRNGDLFMLESHITVSQDLTWVRANVDDLTAFVIKHSALARDLGPVVALNLKPAQAMIAA